MIAHEISVMGFEKLRNEFEAAGQDVEERTTENRYPFASDALQARSELPFLNEEAEASEVADHMPPAEENVALDTDGDGEAPALQHPKDTNLLNAMKRAGRRVRFHTPPHVQSSDNDQYLSTMPGLNCQSNIENKEAGDLSDDQWEEVALPANGADDTSPDDGIHHLGKGADYLDGQSKRFPLASQGCANRSGHGPGLLPSGDFDRVTGTREQDKEVEARIRDLEDKRILAVAEEIKQRNATQERLKLTLTNAGYADDVIAEAMRREGKKLIDPSRPTYIKVHRKHLSPRSLDAYQLPWKWDEVIAFS